MNFKICVWNCFLKNQKENKFTIFISIPSFKKKIIKELDLESKNIRNDFKTIGVKKFLGTFNNQIILAIL